VSSCRRGPGRRGRAPARRLGSTTQSWARPSAAARAKAQKTRALAGWWLQPRASHAHGDGRGRSLGERHVLRCGTLSSAVCCDDGDRRRMPLSPSSGSGATVEVELARESTHGAARRGQRAEAQLEGDVEAEPSPRAGGGHAVAPARGRPRRTVGPRNRPGGRAALKRGASVRSVTVPSSLTEKERGSPLLVVPRQTPAVVAGRIGGRRRWRWCRAAVARGERERRQLHEIARARTAQHGGQGFKEPPNRRLRLQSRRAHSRHRSPPWETAHATSRRPTMRTSLGCLTSFGPSCSWPARAWRPPQPIRARRHRGGAAARPPTDGARPRRSRRRRPRAERAHAPHQRQRRGRHQGRQVGRGGQPHRRAA
jgi:hypothetical protein